MLLSNVGDQNLRSRLKNLDISSVWKACDKHVVSWQSFPEGMSLILWPFALPSSVCLSVLPRLAYARGGLCLACIALL